MFRISLFISVILAFVSNTKAQVIDQVVFENLTRTKPAYLQQQLDLVKGDPIDSISIDRNVQFLKDLNLFFDVSYRIDETSDSTATLCFVIDEAKYIYPVVSEISTDEKINFSLGVIDINFLGRSQTIGLQYQYYDRHSFKFFQTAPRHRNNRTGHEFFLGKYSTIEPLYFGEESVRFKFDNYHVSSALYYWFNRYLKASAGGMLMYERYEDDDRFVMFGDKSFDVGDHFNLFKYQVRGTLTYSQVNYNEERRDGLSNHIHSEFINTPQMVAASFVKVTNDLRYYREINKRGNFSVRNRVGFATNRNSPFAPFVIDGFINVRGSGDRIARGTAETIINAEYLHTFLRHKWLFAQVGAFADFAYLRPGGQSIKDMLTYRNGYYFSGPSLRLQTRLLYKAVIRFDYGFDLKDPSKGGFTVGFNHFF